MAATKTAKTLLTSQSLAASASIATSEWAMSTTYGGILGIKLTNGGTAPTTAPTVTVYLGEATGIKRKYYQALGDTVNSSVSDILCELPTSTMFCNVTITNGSGQAITVEAYGQELTTV